MYDDIARHVTTAIILTILKAFLTSGLSFGSNNLFTVIAMQITANAHINNKILLSNYNTLLLLIPLFEKMVYVCTLYSWFIFVKIDFFKQKAPALAGALYGELIIWFSA
jgi:hypothetical protein